ncbi:hypothetical protein [Porphyromonas endodontalis]|jgi:hypothetical protein|uniref:hypothetical protein n=1 Tax=Porphyromonas endodontalis TaxID=28124 RepID=UPI0028804831|nr:hypothetical protein [Porphyromonas endodontalis]
MKGLLVGAAIEFIAGIIDVIPMLNIYRIKERGLVSGLVALLIGRSFRAIVLKPSFVGVTAVMCFWE